MQFTVGQMMFYGGIAGAIICIIILLILLKLFDKKRKKKLDEMLDKVKDIDAKEVKESIESKIEEIKEELTDLDKEKVLEIAKTKAKQIHEKAEELVDYAIEKGTPVLEKAATNIRNKAIVVTKEVLDKLENGNKKVKASK